MLIEAARRAAVEPVFHRPPILRRSSQRAWREAEGCTIRVRLARLICAAVKHWPTHETMSCARWYVDRLEELWDQIRCSDEVIADIDRYWGFLNDLLVEFERTYGKVDPLYFGRLITFLDEFEIGFSHVMAADRAFFSSARSMSGTGLMSMKCQRVHSKIWLGSPTTTSNGMVSNDENVPAVCTWLP